MPTMTAPFTAVGRFVAQFTERNKVGRIRIPWVTVKMVNHQCRVMASAPRWLTAAGTATAIANSRFGSHPPVVEPTHSQVTIPWLLSWTIAGFFAPWIMAVGEALGKQFLRYRRDRGSTAASTGNVGHGFNCSVTPLTILGGAYVAWNPHANEVITSGVQLQGGVN